MTAPAVTAAELAVAQARRQQLLTRTVVDQAEAAWSVLDPDAIAASWAQLVPGVAGLVAVGQYTAAAHAEEYVDTVAGPGAAAVRPDGFAGAAADGRPLASLLALPAGTTLNLIGSGLGVGEALARGRAQLLLAVQTEVADAGRLAAGAGMTARPQVHGYVRVVSPPACGRCVVLAGRVYRWSAGFARHPRCDCTMAPVGSAAADVARTPEQLFHGMTAAEQDTGFTKAGAQAVRDGADIGRVVNAQRGMYTAGGRSFTREATTRRGRLPGQAGGARLTPTQVYLEAGSDRGEAVRLLTLHGYLI